MELLGLVHRRRSRVSLTLQFLRAVTLSLALAWLPSAASALDTGQSKTVDGLTVYIGAMPAEIVKGHPESHPEASAHGGPPSGVHEYHFVVAIFDSVSGARISNAKVSARVSGLGLVGPKKTLEPMKIEDTVTYGDYFNLPDKGLYTIDMEIERPAGTVRMEFVYEH